MRGYLLTPILILLLWYPVVHFADDNKGGEEVAVRAVVRAALNCLGDSEQKLVHFFSTRVRRVDGVPPRFDRRKVAEYAAIKEAELGQLEADICPAAVRLSGAFADVDLHYVLKGSDGKETIYRGKVVLNREGDTWKIVELDFR